MPGGGPQKASALKTEDGEQREDGDENEWVTRGKLRTSYWMIPPLPLGKGEVISLVIGGAVWTLKELGETFGEGWAGDLLEMNSGLPGF